MLQRENLVKLDSIILEITAFNNLFLHVITNFERCTFQKSTEKGHCSETIAKLKKIKQNKQQI